MIRAVSSIAALVSSTVTGGSLSGATWTTAVPLEVPSRSSEMVYVKRSSPEKRAAAWELVKFLVAPEQIEGFATASGYVPIRKSAAASATVQDFWAKNPTYRVAYDQLLAPGGPAANGSVIGAYQGVRDSVRDGLVAMLSQGLSPEQAVARAQRGADRAIRDYNTRVGK